MSATLFRSKQFKSRKILKNIIISKPITTSAKEISSPSQPVIILRVKYEFTPKTSNELKVVPDEYLKLVEKLGNGWLLVQHIDKIHNRPGLVPASYVTIVVNDSVNPIDIEWLSESNDSYPVSVEINKFSRKADRRICYTINFSMLNGNVIKLDKHYQDFYDFHILLSSLNSSRLPKLPTPIKSMNTDNLFNERCGQLHKYLNQVVSIDCYQKSEEMRNFIQADNSSNTETNTSFSPTTPYSPTASFSPTAPLPPISSNYTRKNSNYNIELANSKYSTYIHQAQAQDNFISISNSNSFLSLIDNYDDKSVAESKEPPVDELESPLLNASFTFADQKNSFSSTSSGNSLFSERIDGSFTQSSTPIISSGFQVNSPKRNSPELENEFVKIKISINNDENDMILLKLKRSNITSVAHLKKLISFKIYKDTNLTSHYSLQVVDDGLTETNTNDKEMISYIKSRSKVCLKIVRLRKSLP